MSERRLPVAQTLPPTGRVRARTILQTGVVVVLLVAAGCVILFLSFSRLVRRDVKPNETPIEEFVRTLDGVDAFIDSIAKEVVVAHAARDDRTELGFGLYVYQPKLEENETEPANCLQREHWVRWDDVATKPTAGVVLVHGLDEPGSIWNTTVRTLAPRGFSVLRFEYPNDGPIVGAADLFERELVRAHKDGLERLTYIGHSMGGLVTLETLTRDQTGGESASIPETTRLIAVGTPFGGSAWARLRAVAEVRDQVERFVTDDSIGSAAMLRHMQDGMGEAGDDLMPGSPFFVQLNARTFPPSFPVTCVVGKLRQSTRIDPSWMRDSFVLNSLFGKDQNASMVDSLSTLVDDLGDGVVPIASASPVWATDVVNVQASHRGLLESLAVERFIDNVLGDEPPENEIPPAILIILERLRQDTQTSGG